ncbi:hypothetical protein F5X96DRAFT_50847 [Biscogniauxia mediterranea]|nr:hypothetical protein F5X96DRAFT_50847 [Biscogniauxia mediterranea]
MDSSTNGPGSPDLTDDAAARVDTSEDLLRRAKTLLAEVEHLGHHLTKVYNGYFQKAPLDMHVSFASTLRTEIECIKKDINSADPFASHRLQSSNLPFFELVWDMAKRQRNIVKLRFSVFPGEFKTQILGPGSRIVLSQGDSRPSRGHGFIIDCVADGGSSWWKVSSMTNKRLLFDMAKEAIYCGDSEDEDGDDSVAQDLSDIPLVKMAKTLAHTARGYRFQNASPTPYLVLPRVVEKQHAEVDKILDACRNMGVNLICSSELTPAPPLSYDLLHAIVPGPKAKFSHVLNIDTSVLVALASDFSHTKVEKQAWFSHSHNDHTDLESKEHMLPLVYPILDGHELVCTKEAADAFSHIVNTIATDAESARAHLILNVDSAKSSDQRVEELRSLSIHGVPPSLKLPIRIVDANENNCQSRFSPEVSKKLSVLLNPGRSVFAYGWARGITTLTCNAVAIKQLEKELEKLSSLGGLEWPSMWAFPTSRPLVGTPKDGSIRKRIRKHIGDCSVACTCGVEELYGGRSDVTII